MSAPTATAEAYISCVNLDATLGAVVMDIQDGGVMITGSQDDMTHNKDGGWESDAATTVVGDVDLTIAFKTSTPSLFVVNGIYPFLANVATMPTFVAGTFTVLTPVDTTKPAFAGQVRITSMTSMGFNVKQGFKVQIKGKTQHQCGYLV